MEKEEEGRVGFMDTEGTTRLEEKRKVFPSALEKGKKKPETWGQFKGTLITPYRTKRYRPVRTPRAP